MSDDGEVVETPYGDYVSADDYDQVASELQSAIDELNEERDNYKDLVNQIRDLYIGVK
jgi:hypothetical protein